MPCHTQFFLKFFLYFYFVPDLLVCMVNVISNDGTQGLQEGILVFFWSFDCWQLVLRIQALPYMKCTSLWVCRRCYAHEAAILFHWSSRWDFHPAVTTQQATVIIAMVYMMFRLSSINNKDGCHTLSCVVLMISEVEVAINLQCHCT